MWKRNSPQNLEATESTKARKPDATSVPPNPKSVLGTHGTHEQLDSVCGPTTLQWLPDKYQEDNDIVNLLV